VVRAGLADKLQFPALLWPSCAKHVILFLRGGQREPGIPEPHEPGHIRERLKEVRATHARRRNPGRYLHRARTAPAGGVAFYPNSRRSGKPLPAPVPGPGAWPRSNGADPKTKAVKDRVAGDPRQDTVPFLSCLEEQKLRFQRPGTLRCAPCSCPPGRKELAGLSRPASELRPPRALRSSPALEIPGSVSKPNETPRRYQNGPSSWTATASGEGGESNGSCQAGGGDYRQIARGGDMDLFAVAATPGTAHICRGTASTVMAHMVSPS
jgi:hypothetical protein